MEHLFFHQVKAGDIVFINETHVPNDVFAPALPNACYACIHVLEDQLAVRTHGIIHGQVYPAKDFVPLTAIERVVPLAQTEDKSNII